MKLDYLISPRHLPNVDTVDALLTNLAQFRIGTVWIVVACQASVRAPILDKPVNFLPMFYFNLQSGTTF